MKLLAHIDGRYYEILEVDAASWDSINPKTITGVPAYHHTDKNGLHIWPMPNSRCDVYRLEPQPYVGAKIGD